jgi:leucyl aminopeptidase
MTVIIDPAFAPVPSLAVRHSINVTTVADAKAQAAAVFVTAEGSLPQDVALDRAALAAAGFTGKKGQTLLLPSNTTPVTVLVGTGTRITDAGAVRDAVASFTRSARESGSLSVDLRDIVAPELSVTEIARAATEGAILARYRYDALKSDPTTVPLSSLSLTVTAEDQQAAEAGVARGVILARATTIARDLANTPPRHLSAEKFAEIAVQYGPDFGLEVEVFDRAALMALGTGGLLGVNAGSTEEPRMIKLSYRPEGATAHLALVGKGIMYDSGGISLKPSNAMHLAMKFDMMGAAAVFSAMVQLRDLGATSNVTGWLMCTDNMPSGSATKLGDVLTIRGGTTVEVKNTDAEGRLVLADGLVLATEEAQRPNAIVDIATLTGAAMAALGTRTAAMLANNDAIASQLEAAATATAEGIWRLPLEHNYREQLNSEVADLSNMGGEYAGTTTAALFLNEFVDGIPWGHLDIAGTMKSDRDDLWRSAGSTGFGARLLAEFAVAFTAPIAPTEK